MAAESVCEFAESSDSILETSSMPGSDSGPEDAVSIDVLSDAQSLIEAMSLCSHADGEFSIEWSEDASVSDVGSASLCSDDELFAADVFDDDYDDENADVNEFDDSVDDLSDDLADDFSMPDVDTLSAVEALIESLADQRSRQEPLSMHLKKRIKVASQGSEAIGTTRNFSVNWSGRNAREDRRFSQIYC